MILVLQILAYVVSCVLVLAGILLSAIAVSGTWLVFVASGLLALVRPESFPGWGTCAVLLVVCIVVEVLDTWASALGVKWSGGSKWSGLASVGGGILGAVVGAATPVALLTVPLGMIAGSFLAAYAVERHLSRDQGQAVRVGKGTAIARVAVGMLKLVATLGMTGYLVVGLIAAR